LSLLRRLLSGKIVPEDLPGAFLHTGFAATSAIGDTCAVVNGHDPFKAHRFGRASLDAHLAGDTSDLADFLDPLSGILGAARDPDPCFPREELDDLLRAGAHAGPAADTGHRVNDREIIHHLDGVKGTGGCALSEADASVLALLRPAKGKIGSRTRPVTNVSVFLGDVPLLSGAPHPCDYIFDGTHFFPRDVSYLFGHFGFARETEAGLDFRIIHNRFGIGFAPGVAAPASLSARQNFKDFLDLRIGFDGKFLGRKGQPDAEDEADASEHGKSDKGCRNQSGIH
jgi:hypothetical protein